jgi:Ca2+-binding EF-hand superfamily protein
VHGMLQQLGIKVQKFELNKILENHDRNKDGHLNKEEFEEVRTKSKQIYFYLSNFHRFI